MANNYTVISDLAYKSDIEDSNLIIVEDQEDTKQSTILDLKKSLLGDYKKPNETLFYSSQKVEERFNNFTRELASYASEKDLRSIENRIEDIIVSAGDDNTEIVYARDGMKALSVRLDRDILDADNKYVTKVRKVVEGNQVSTGNTGFVDICLNVSADVLFKSKNVLDVSNNTSGNGVTYTETGFEYSQINNNMEVSLKLGSSLPKGTYYFFSSKSYDALFNDRGNVKFVVKNSRDDSAYTEFVYNQSSKFEFTAPKAFDEIKLIFNTEKYSSTSVARYTNLMLTRNAEYGETYIPYASKSVSLEKDINLYYYNENYDISCSDKNGVVRVEYYDNAITMASMQTTIDEMKSVVINNGDKCGLTTNYGEYLFFDNVISENPTACKLSYDNDKYMRNGTPSLKLTFNGEANTNPILTLQMKQSLDNIDSISLVLYVDRTVSYYFIEEYPISIYLCSDNYQEPDMVNYYQADIHKLDIIQGWGVIKIPASQFVKVGSPNIHAIKYIKIEIHNNSILDNKSIYLNSVVFNQTMKPVVLLAFDGMYEDGVEYTYPYLTNKEFPATIFTNNNTTYSRSLLEAVETLRVKNGWDIGQYGCHPNKEILTYDDNARPQYLALKTTKTWLNDNLVLNPISYSPPYGNLRPISVPILKDLGYKIAKVHGTAYGYINFFDPKYDFAIPMQLISNNITEEEIIAGIQYAIDNQCGICLYTHNVTEYGDESSVKKIVLENIIKFILDNSDKITPMTFSDFYNKCKG